MVLFDPSWLHDFTPPRLWKPTTAKRKGLHSPIPEWPESNEHTKYSLLFTGDLVGIESKLEEALMRPDIDKLLFTRLSASNGSFSTEAMEIMAKLMAQDRGWSVEYESLVPNIEFLTLLKRVRYLKLSLPMTEQVVSILAAFPDNRQVLYSGYSVRPTEFYQTYQVEGLAKKMPHVSLSIDDEECRLPPTANKHLQSLAFSLTFESKVKVLTEWMYQASQLENLRYLSLYIYESPQIDYSESMQVLATWIRSPHCRLSHFLLGANMGTPQSFQEFPMLMEALGQNRSIQKFGKDGCYPQLNWTRDILPNLSLSVVLHLRVGIVWEDKAVSIAQLLLEWLRQMRDTRLLTIHAWFKHVKDRKNLDRLEYMSAAHERWINLSPEEPSETPQSSSATVAAVPRTGWAYELCRLDRIEDPNLRVLSLDATFYLLQHWLSSIADIPHSS